jgi:hypothetical protein
MTMFKCGFNTIFEIKIYRYLILKIFKNILPGFGSVFVLKARSGSAESEFGSETLL